MRKLHLNYYIILIFSFFSLGILIQSCNENSTGPSTSSNNITTEFVMPTVKNNVLTFNSRNDFKGLIQKLNDKPADKLNKFIANKFKGFSSLKQAKYQIMKNKSSSPENSDILQLNIQDPNFASILNKKGVVQIGDIVYKITNRYTYIFKNRSAWS